MKLKGMFAKKLKPADRKKKEETLERMTKTREIDTQNLRNLIEKKLEWAENQRLEGLKQMEALKTQVLRLEGIILFVKDLLQPKENKNEKK